MKLPCSRYHRYQYCALAFLVFLFGAFLSISFLGGTNHSAYADDGTPIRQSSDTGEYFVAIHDQGTSLTVKATSATVAEILASAQVDIAETDIVEPALDTVVTSNFHINIYRARPAIMVVGMERRYLMTASYDPRQIALEAGFTVYDGDHFVTEFNTNFLEAGAVSVYRLERGGGTTFTAEEPIPYPTETRYDYNLAKGESYLEQAGEDGRRVPVYEIQFEDGIEVARTLLSDDIKLEPVTEIVVVGAQSSIPPERAACAEWARAAGVAEEELEAAIDLIYRESGCRVDATNAYSGAYGIPQALPGNKMAAFGDDWETNPVTQIRWMARYVTERYGGWQQALDYWWCTGVCASRNGTITKNGHWY